MSTATGATGGYVTEADKVAQPLPAQNGVMVALMLPDQTAAHLQALGRGVGLSESDLLPADEMHVTLAYLGTIDEVNRHFGASDEESVSSALERFATGWRPIKGSLNGFGRFFEGGSADCLYLNFDSPVLPQFRQALIAFLKSEDFPLTETHGYSPHSTLAYVSKDTPTPPLPLHPIEVTFTSMTLAWGGEYYDIPFGLPANVKGHRHMAYKIVKSREDKRYRVLDLSNGLRLPPDGFALRDEAISYKTSIDAPDDDTDQVVDAAKSALMTRERPTNASDTMPHTDPAAADDPVNTDDAAMMSADSSYAYPEGSALPMPDAKHVVMAAAALGPNPPHGKRAQIPSDKLGEVKSRIRARAQMLGLGKSEMAKVNAYLSGRMPGDVSEKDADLWANAYNRVYSLTSDETKAALAAQGAINRCAIMGRKSADGSLPTTVAGWAMLFSDPEDLDLQGTYFDDMTKTMAEYYPRAPLWMEHGKDSVYGGEPIGFRTDTQVFPIGIWLEHALNTDHPLYERTAKDAADGVFAYSSDSLTHYAQQGFDPADGRLGLWPLAGCSLTRTPAEPGLGPVQAKSLELALKSALVQREAASTTTGETESTKGTSMDNEDTQVKPAKDEVVEAEKTDTMPDEVEETKSTEPISTLKALADMYGVDEDATAVRSAIDDHISAMRSSGMSDDKLCKALGLPDGAPPTDVEEQLNNLYTNAVTPRKDDMVTTPDSPDEMPEATMSTRSFNYGALANHLSSGGVVVKSQGPYMTPEIAKKAINNNFGAKVPGIMETVYDMMRVKNGMTPKFGSKAMTSATGPTGGYVLRQEIAPNVLDPLRAQSVAFQLGATRIDMQGLQVMQIPAMQSAPTGNWIGENVAVTTSQPGYRMMAMVPHGYQVTVPIPINVEANMTPEAESQLRQQMVLTGQLALDLAALTGPGSADASNSGAAPIGILNTPGVRQMKLATNGRQPNFLDIVNANRLLDQKNVPQAGNKRGLAFHSDVEASFTGQTDSLGRPLIRDSWSDAPNPRILNFPYRTENQIPTTLTVGNTSNNSYLFFGDWRYLYIGLSDMVELRLDQTFMQNLQVGLLVYFYADVKVVYPDSFVVGTGVQGVNISGVTITTNS